MHRQAIIVGTVLALCGSTVSHQPAQAQVVDTFLALTTCYQREMYLANWGIEVVFYAGDSTQSLASTQWDLVEQKATISYDTVRVNTPDVIRVTVVHELFHVLTAELAWLAMQESKAAMRLASERTARVVESWPMWMSLCGQSGGG